MTPRRRVAAPLGGLAAVLLAGCDLAPAYHPPTTVLPAAYKGAGIWAPATPADTLPRGPWWARFGNPVLNGLEARLPANPELAAARESYEQARDLAAEAASGLYPQLGSQYSMSANRQSEHRLFRSPTSTAPPQEPSVQLDALASWEIDLWDRIGNETRARRRLAQAQSATVDAVRLSLQATLANAYLTVRGLDQEATLYRSAIGFYQTGVKVTELRLNGSIGNLLDVERARDQLAATEALLTETIAQRVLAEHAIATLIDVPASAFSLPPQQDTPMILPTIPAGVPSALLQRRPDVAAAERDMAAANAEIGVARAAFYPNISLSGIVGEQDSGFNLVSLPNSMWSIGAAIVEPLFEGGLRTAELRYARSSYAQTRDQYRVTVLGAVQQVEDQLALTGLLARESTQTAAALQSATKVQTLALKLYENGLDNYLNVVVAQNAGLAAGFTAAEVAIRDQTAVVNLVRALGGGWSTADLPSDKAVMPFDPLSFK